ncbi:hypothetical protein BO78DRAFT_391567 [Aspergillus sclerotiicarbonarius CBS 121057]|uniref:Uncharacterized protein n=1 Tax=Aspergillus sclerotiicarbonarius (strain CBS 121057 / IBT 28362) TaxID=1448318 RepID=A0A319F6K8_ASPSB|nr:hypothetical protein BO78DRAFT_391567 [Aspergillus sclerotiicarbonarius CBS 121057]
METEYYAHVRKMQRQDAVRKGHETRRRKREAKRKRMQNARQYRSKHASVEPENDAEAKKKRLVAGPSSAVPNDPIRAWFEDRMSETHALSLRSEISRRGLKEEEEKYNLYLEYYQLVRILAEDLVAEALDLRFQNLFFAKYWEYLPKDKGIWDLTDWDLLNKDKLIDAMLPAIDIDEEYEKGREELIKVWGNQQVKMLHIYGRWKLVACTALAKKEPNWDIVARRLNRAVLERWTRQGQNQERGYSVQGCDILRALAMEVPTEPVSEQELASMNGIFNHVGLITTRNDGVAPFNSGPIDNW